MSAGPLEGLSYRKKRVGRRENKSTGLLRAFVSLLVNRRVLLLIYAYTEKKCWQQPQNPLSCSFLPNATSPYNFFLITSAETSTSFFLCYNKKFAYGKKRPGGHVESLSYRKKRARLTVLIRKNASKAFVIRKNASASLEQALHVGKNAWYKKKRVDRPAGKPFL